LVASAITNMGVLFGSVQSLDAFVPYIGIGLPTQLVINHTSTPPIVAKSTLIQLLASHSCMVPVAPIRQHIPTKSSSMIGYPPFLLKALAPCGSIGSSIIQTNKTLS